MIKTPLSTMIGGAGIWTPGATIIGSTSATLDTIIRPLFSDGTQGIYLNAQDALSVSDLSSIKDLSGNNNHALQANSTSRASLITDPSGYKSLKFDGIDDGYVTQSINFTNTDKVTVIAAVRKLSDAATQMIVESSAGNVAAGVFGILKGGGSTDYFQTLMRGSASWAYATATNQIYAAPKSVILTARLNMAGSPKQELKINNVLAASSTVDVGTTNFANQPIYIGRRGGTSLPFNGQIYALLVIGKLLDDATTAKIEKEFAKYIGVTL